MPPLVAPLAVTSSSVRSEKKISYSPAQGWDCRNALTSSKTAWSSSNMIFPSGRGTSSREGFSTTLT